MTYPVQATSALATQFQRLDNELWQTRAFWQPAPFHGTPAWCETHGALAAALLALDDAEAQALEHDPHALCGWLARFLPALGALPALTRIPALVATPGEQRFPVGFEWDIPGRKWTQITHFSDCITNDPAPVVDWCAGKGHLARCVSHRQGRPVLAVERDGGLIEAGKALAAKHGLGVAFCAADVLLDPADTALPDGHAVMALHACGDLHRHLVSQVCTRRVPQLTFSPCCYHKTQDALCTPFNGDLGRLTVPRETMALAVQETVTAKRHEVRQRDRKAQWRLAWQTLQAQARIQGGDLPALGKLPASAYAIDVRGFCEAQAMRSGITLPAVTDWEALTRSAALAHGHIRRLELVRHAFRRALEVWRVLDGALWLERHGYAVEVGTFCEASVTPRNLVVRARLLAGDVLA